MEGAITPPLAAKKQKEKGGMQNKKTPSQATPPFDPSLQQETMNQQHKNSSMNSFTDEFTESPFKSLTSKYKTLGDILDVSHNISLREGDAVCLC